MAGDFSNQKQSLINPQLYAHIHIFFRPLPFEFFSGIGFYSEQVYDYDLWTPYRQGIHRLIEQGDRIYIENYSLKDPVLYAGAARELDILRTITSDCSKVSSASVSLCVRLPNQSCIAPGFLTTATATVGRPDQLWQRMT